MKKNHRYFMEAALREAKAAAAAGEAPVGAVVVLEDEIIGRGRNRMESERDPTAHAEFIALAEARESLNEKFLTGATLYCTLEPCPMCAGAAVLNRIERIVYGANEPNWGGCGTLFNIPQEKFLNHRVEIIGGVMEDECSRLLKDFFEKLRQSEG